MAETTKPKLATVADEGPEVADPFAIENFEIPEAEFQAEMAGAGELTVRFGQPKKFEYFRAHPEWQFAGRLYVWEEEGRIDKEFYLISPNLKPADTGVEEDESKSTLLRAVVTSVGQVCIVPTYPNSDNAYHKSGIQGIALAETKWVRLSAKRTEGRYRIIEAEDQSAMGNSGSPVWPKEIIEGRSHKMEVLKRALGSTGLISDRNHEALLRHRGKQK